MRITADHREKFSGIIDLLGQVGAEVVLEVGRLKAGDYIINDAITVERKTARDFLVSLVDGRLFNQVSRLKHHGAGPVLLIEGNPFKTGLGLDPAAIRGALLSVQTIWYLPVIHSRSIDDTVSVLLTMGRQEERCRSAVPLRSDYRPRRLKTRKLFFLQGLPGIGPQIAQRLMAEFGSLGKVLSASVEELEKIRGVGAETARNLRHFLDR